MSKKRLAIGAGSWLIALFFAYEAIAVNRKPLTFVGTRGNHFAVTDEKKLLEMGDMLDKLGQMGYSDGRGNRLKIGDRYRELVRQRRQKRLIYWSIAGFFAIIGLVSVLKRSQPVPAQFAPSGSLGL